MSFQFTFGLIKKQDIISALKGQEGEYVRVLPVCDTLEWDFSIYPVTEVEYLTEVRREAAYKEMQAGLEERATKIAQGVKDNLRRLLDHDPH